MRKIIMIFAGIIIFYNAFSQTEEFSVKEKSVIYTNSLNILKSYKDIINQICDNVVNNLEAANSGSESFL